MTLKEAKITIYANVIYACEMAGFPPMTIKLVKDACDTVIELAAQADTPQTDLLVKAPRKSRESHEKETEPQVIACPIQEEDAEYARWLYEDEPQTDCAWGKGE